MKERRSRLIFGAGALCFVGVMAVWLAASGDKAIAEGDRAPSIIQSVTQTMAEPVDLEGVTASEVTIGAREGAVQRLSVFLHVETADPSRVKVYLTSPSGTNVLVVDGSRSEAVKGNALTGWFGTDGMATAESLAAFAGEPATGTWKLTVDAKDAGKLVKWSLAADLGADTKMASMETFGEYNDGGCDCNLGRTGVQGPLALAGLVLLGLLWVRRRR